MRLLKIMLTLLVSLMCGTAAKAQYNPTNPPEPGVYFTLSARCVPADGGYNLSGSGTHAFGSNVGMRVYTTAGYRFLHWEDENGTIVSTTTSFNYTMPAKDVVLIARFEYDPTSPAEPSTPEFKNTSYISFKMNPSDAGYVSSEAPGEYEVSSVQRFYAYAYSNYKFVNWTRNGIEIGTSSTIDFTIPLGDQTLVANFEYDPSNPAEPSVPNIPRTISLKSNLEGAGSLTGAGSHSVGESFTVSAASNTYYHFVNWTDEDGNIVSESSSFAYTMPDRHVTLIANYTYDYDPSNPGEPGTPNPDSGMAENMVLWPRMGMYDNTHVLILCETPGATIHYTIDGSTPTAASPVYAEPVFVGSNLIVKAVAYKEGMEDSPMVSYQVTAYKMTIPIFTFENLKLKITSDTPDAIIRYTLDGSIPSEESKAYTEPLLLTEDCKVVARGFKDHYEPSDTISYTFVYADHVVAKPVLTFNQEAQTITMTCATENAEIRFTTDGSEPTATSGEAYSTPISVSAYEFITGDKNIIAKAFRNDLFDSEPNSIKDLQSLSIDMWHTWTNWDASAEISDSENIYLEDNVGEILDIEEVILGNSEVFGRLFANLTKYAGIYGKGTPGLPIRFLFNRPDMGGLDAPISECNPTFDENGEFTFLFSELTATEIKKFGAAYPYVHLNTIKMPWEFPDGMNQGEIMKLNYIQYDQVTPTPTANFADRKLVLSCSYENASIYYTTDGAVPSLSSALYAGPISLTSDCEVKFIAKSPGYFVSSMASYDFKYVDHQVATPILTYDTEALTITLTCDTENAEIRYTIDGEAPTESTGIKYEDPITVDGNHTYTARAFRSDLFPSEATSVTIDSKQVPTPTASFAKKQLTLACTDANAQIRYTLDGSAPTSESALYTGPLALVSNCTVRFFASHENFNDSDEAIFEFNIVDHTEIMPDMKYDHRERTIEVTQVAGLPVVITIDGESQTVETPALIQVLPEMKNISVYTLAENEDRFDSWIVSDTIIFHKAPKLTYDGHAVAFAPGDGEPYKQSELWCYFNGNLRQYGNGFNPMDVLEFGTASAIVQSDSAFRSEPSEMVIDFFNTGRNAGVRNGHHLSEVFGSWGDSKEDYKYLRVRGEIEKEDLEFIASLPELTTLHLDLNRMTAEPCDSVFADTRIETVFSYSIPQGMLKGMPRLTTVIWGMTNEKMPDGRLSEAGNPNILLWLTDRNNAPSDAINVITYDYKGEGFPTDPESEGIEGHSDHIILMAGYPFNVHMPLRADRIELTKYFTLPTVIDEAAGWESLVLPFDAESIRHEKAGEIIPFAVWDADQNPAGPKPYWLYRPTVSGWDAAKGIEAGVPYIISMPNNEDYVEEFNLPGSVTFSASEVDLKPESMSIEPIDWLDGTLVEGTFMPVESTGHHALNVNGEGGGYSGSRFEPGAKIYPFGAYILGGDRRRAMPIFGNGNGIDQLPAISSSGIVADSPAPGTIRVSSGFSCQTAIVTPDGGTVRIQNLQAGETLIVDGLTKGLYIVGDVKVMVK